MKVLVGAFTFIPNKDGVAEAASAIVHGYLDQGWEVEVLTESLPTPRSNHDWNGACIHEYQRNSDDSLEMVSKDDRSVGEFLRRGDWNVVMFHTYDPLLYEALGVINDIAGAKILVSHGYPGFVRYPMPRFPWGYPSMLRRCIRGLAMLFWIRRFDRVVYLSPQADLKGFYDQFLARLAGYRERVCIPNGIDPDLIGDDAIGFRERHGIAPDVVLFLCVANYSPRKDQGYAARAFRKAAIPNSRLVFIGSEINKHAQKFINEDRSSVSEEVVDDILWLEKLSREETLNAFAACDVFVLSSLHEAQPISLLEAMREGKPWIARKSGCIHRIEGGFCVVCETQMTQAMQRFAEDRDLRARYGSEGKHAVSSRYSLDAFQKAYVRLAKDVVERAPKN